MNGTEEVLDGLVVAGGDPTPLFQAGEEIFNPVPQAIHRSIMAALRTSVANGRNHDRFASGPGGSDDALVSVIAFVGNEGAAGIGRKLSIGPVQIRCLAGRQADLCGLALSIDGRVDLGAQATAAASQRLRIFQGFFWAPALC